MNTYKVSLKVVREGFSGYDHYDIEEHIVQAHNEKSAVNKATKLAVPPGRLSQSLTVNSVRVELVHQTKMSSLQE